MVSVEASSPSSTSATAGSGRLSAKQAKLVNNGAAAASSSSSIQKSKKKKKKSKKKSKKKTKKKQLSKSQQLWLDVQHRASLAWQSTRNTTQTVWFSIKQAWEHCKDASAAKWEQLDIPKKLAWFSAIVKTASTHPRYAPTTAAAALILVLQLVLPRGSSPTTTPTIPITAKPVRAAGLAATTASVPKRNHDKAAGRAAAKAITKTNKKVEGTEQATKKEPGRSQDRIGKALNTAKASMRQFQTSALAKFKKDDSVDTKKRQTEAKKGKEEKEKSVKNKAVQDDTKKQRKKPAIVKPTKAEKKTAGISKVPADKKPQQTKKEADAIPKKKAQQKTAKTAPRPPPSLDAKKTASEKQKAGALAVPKKDTKEKPKPKAVPKTKAAPKAKEVTEKPKREEKAKPAAPKKKKKIDSKKGKPEKKRKTKKDKRSKEENGGFFFFSRRKKTGTDGTNTTYVPANRTATPIFVPNRQSPPQQNLIILGPGSQPGGRPPVPPSTLMLSQAFWSAVSTFFRLWLLSTLARRLADEEMRSLRKPVQHFVWERLNDRYVKDKLAMQVALDAPPMGISPRRWRRHQAWLAVQERKRAAKQKHRPKRKTLLREIFNRTSVVVELGVDESGSIDHQYFEKVVTFVLTQHRSMAFGKTNNAPTETEVILLLESPGGGVSHYGLLAAQFRRLSNEEGITTTVCVDKIAASGGYMIASQASKLYAAPFAVVGSIGVLTENVNFHRILEKNGVDTLVLTAGDAKAPLTTLGKLDEKGIGLVQRHLDRVHAAFRSLVVGGRPELTDSIDDVADGDIYFGEEAEQMSLIDYIKTSEEYILERIEAGDRVLKLHRLPVHARHRRRLNPLDFLDFIKRGGTAWLASVDWKCVVPMVFQATSALGFLQHVLLRSNKRGDL